MALQITFSVTCLPICRHLFCLYTNEEYRTLICICNESRCVPMEIGRILYTLYFIYSQPHCSGIHHVWHSRWKHTQCHNIMRVCYFSSYMIMYHFMIMHCSVYIVFISWYWNLTVYSDTLMEIQDIHQHCDCCCYVSSLVSCSHFCRLHYWLIFSYSFTLLICLYICT